MKLFALFTSLILALSVTACATATTYHEKPPASVEGHEAVSAIQEQGVFHLACYDAAGNLKWEEDAHNALANVGESSILDTYFRGASAPAGFYLRLYNATPGLTDTLTSLASYEPATNYGYNPANNTITRDSTGWPTLQLSSSHYQVVSKTVTITASGGSIGPVTYAAIATTSNNTGVLVAYAPLSASRTLSSGDALNVTYTVRLQ